MRSIQSFQARCFSVGRDTLNSLVFTRHPGMTLLSEGLASARNFEMANRSSRGKDSSPSVPRGASDHVERERDRGGPPGPVSFQEGAEDVVQAALVPREIVRVRIVDRERLRWPEGVLPPHVTFVIVDRVSRC